LKKLIVILPLAVISLFLHAQTGHLFRNININEGLSQSSVVSIALDNTGFLWFATQDGLNRYDGKEFLVFNKIFDDVTKPSGNQLGKVVAGQHNDLWLITSGGRLERFNLYNHSFSSLNKITKDSITLPAINCLYADSNGQLWIGTESAGLIKYSLGKGQVTWYKKQQLTDEHIQSIFRDKEGFYWILTKNGINVFDSAAKQVKTFFHSAFPHDASSFSAIDQDKDGAIWIGSFGKGIFLKEKSNTTPVAFTGFSSTATIPADLVVHSIKCGNDGKIWVGTYGSGLYLIDKKQKTVHHFTADRKKPFALAYQDVLCIEEDNKGGIWIGTDGGGLSYYHTALNNFITYSETTVPGTISIEQVRSITTDKNGNIWAGTSNQGLVFIDPDENVFRQIHFPYYKGGSYVPERIVSLLCDDEGDIWVGTQGNGLLILDAKTGKTKKWFHPDAIAALQLPDHTTWCMLPLGNNKVITGTQNAGLCLVDKQAGVVSNARFSGSNASAENNIRAITRISDTVLAIGYERKGMAMLNIHTGKFTSLSQPAFHNMWSGDVIIRSLAWHPPFLLCGTAGKGLIIHHLPTGKQQLISHEQGLPNNTVYGILEDKQGYLWLSSNKGLNRFRMPDDPAAINKFHFTVFGAEDGLQSNEFNTGAFYAGPDGSLYFGGIRGLNVFNPVHFAKNDANIPVVITQATINNQPLHTDTIISYKKVLRLKYNQHSFSFNFAALDFLSNTRINYSYRLSGYDKNWIDAGNRNYVAYTNLSPGNYVFEIKASGQTGNQPGKITQLSIMISPPFWQRWWFIALCILAVAGILYALYRYRVNQLLQIQKVRSRIATDLHDDIGSTLTNINILSELSKKNIDHRKEAELFLNRITEEVNVSSQALDDIVWSINKNNDNVAQTVARMRRYATEVLEGTNIKYSLQSDEQVAHRRLNMELRRDFYLLFKESVTNIYKHSRASNVQILVWIDRSLLKMKIQDDGVGFDSTATTHRNGIKNMRARAAKWKGVIDIQSAPMEGTTMEISLPVS
jgi:ligand-binding sensor domain-containing protein/two-component sensor histidine kinase